MKDVPNYDRTCKTLPRAHAKAQQPRREHRPQYIIAHERRSLSRLRFVFVNRFFI
jgi:hypothetical protein